MIRFSICIFCVFCFLISNGQIKGDYIWQLGYGSYEQTQDFPTSIQANFNNGTIEVDTFYRTMSFDLFNTSICDNYGKLLLYSNGCQIRDGNHKYIEGTNHLTPGSVDDEWCIQNKLGYPIFDGGLFLPFFNDSIIFLLHQRVVVETSPLNIYINALFYTSVIKKDDSYLLLNKTVPILSNDLLSNGSVEAVKGIKKDSWWIIQAQTESNIYYTILLDSAQVDTTFKQSIGSITLEEGEASGQSVFSPDGTMYARYTPADDLFLFDFDRTTGLLSNFRKFHVADSGNIGGIAFSASSQFLYVSARYDLYQFNLASENIQESKIHLGHYDGFFDPLPITFSAMFLGPDCRIYVIPPSGGRSWHVINNPDLEGMACGFQQHAFHFPVSNTRTMPNFPNYRLDIGPPCDPNIVSGFWEYHVEYTPVSIYPNPTTGVITLKLGDQWLDKGQIDITIVDQYGRVCLTDHFAASDKVRTLSLADLPGGIYFLSVRSAKRWYSTKISKI